MQATTTSHPKDVVSHTKLHRHGAEAAREAHNLEDTGSKPVAGISHSRVYQNPPRCIHTQQHFTGMAQRERAGLITPRSLVRIQFPVYYIIVRFTEPDRQAGRKT